MKKPILILFIMILGVGVFGANSFAGMSAKSRVPVKHIYVPNGFDNNDNVEVVVTGELPNLCYYAPSVDVEVKDMQVKLSVTAYRKSSQKELCPLVVVPFTLTARLGVLASGNYKIVANGGIEAEQNTQVKIVKASSSLVDEHIYANVDSVSRVAGTQTIILDGYNPSMCYQLDRIEALSNGKDTIAVLPIMKQVSDVCPMKLVPFSIRYEIASISNANEFLVHVRSMKGVSVNYLFLKEE